MKLTALFTARRGRSFLQALSAKEARNYQFDFLKPTHSLFPIFNQLIEQYTKVLLPPPAMLGQLKKKARPGAKWEMLESARKHAKWEQKKKDQEKRREDDRESERCTSTLSFSCFWDSLHQNMHTQMILSCCSGVRGDRLV